MEELQVLLAESDLDSRLQRWGRGPPASAMYEPAAPFEGIDREMKGLLVLTLMLMALAATAFAYGPTEMAAAVSVPDWPGEPAALLLSGSALLGVAGAVRRFTF